MQNLDLFPEEDDALVARVPEPPPSAWALSLVVLMMMLVAGAAVLG